MQRAHLEHIIRAAAKVADERDIVIVGSQAILGQFPDAPESMLVSQDADVFPRDHPDRADEIDGALGDGSQFHATFGYYAHGVGPETAKAPAGWEARLVPVCNQNTGGATGWCLEAHDLILAKGVAGRDRDWDFIDNALEHELVDPARLLSLVDDLPVSKARAGQIRRSFDARIGQTRAR